MSNTTVISRCQCQPKSVDAFKKITESFLIPTRKEPGCNSYGVYQDSQDPTGFIFHEIWKDQNGINDHIASAHFNSFMTQAAPLLLKVSGDSPFLVTIAQPLDPQNPPTGNEIVVASLCSALTGKIPEIMNRAPDMILKPSLAEAGCNVYSLYQGLDKKEDFILYEVWKGFPAIQSHMGTPHFGSFMGAAPTLFKPVDKDQYFQVMICKPYA